jgi:hypothetical protein
MEKSSEHSGRRRENVFGGSQNSGRKNNQLFNFNWKGGKNKPTLATGGTPMSTLAPYHEVGSKDKIRIEDYEPGCLSSIE